MITTQIQLIILLALCLSLLNALSLQLPYLCHCLYCITHCCYTQT